MNALKTIAAALLALFIATPVSALSVTLGGSADASASASTSAGNVNITAAIQARISKGKDRADQEIQRRIDSLNDLNTRIQAMVRLTGQQKSTMASEIGTQISTLNDLKVKIDADTDIDTLKADIKSITDAYRIFMLIIPQGRITVAADRITDVASDLNAFSTKLSARISAAESAGKDVTSIKTTLNDMNAKITDANTQSSAAVGLIGNLTPDNGDQTKAAANNAALKSAHADIKTSVQDLVTAKQDAHTIVKALVALKIDVQASASASTTTQ